MKAQDNFWENVKVGEEEECWPWIRGVTSAGYGQCYFFGRYDSMNAHRVAWILSNDKIPPNLWVLHKCDNRLCCNPNHLYLGTPGDNARDRSKRTSIQPHWNASTAKLHNYEILKIKSITGKTQKSIAKQFNVDQATISRVLNSKVYLCKEGYYI